jgi:hypothetical protein
MISFTDYLRIALCQSPTYVFLQEIGFWFQVRISQLIYVFSALYIVCAFFMDLLIIGDPEECFGIASHSLEEASIKGSKSIYQFRIDQMRKIAGSMERYIHEYPREILQVLFDEYLALIHQLEITRDRVH